MNPGYQCWKLQNVKNYKIYLWYSPDIFYLCIFSKSLHFSYIIFAPKNICLEISDFFPNLYNFSTSYFHNKLLVKISELSPNLCIVFPHNLMTKNIWLEISEWFPNLCIIFPQHLTTNIIWLKISELCPNLCISMH